jgi:hypothetical protein
VIVRTHFPRPFILNCIPFRAGDAPAEVAPHRAINVQPYPIRLVNWFMSK